MAPSRTPGQIVDLLKEWIGSDLSQSKWLAQYNESPRVKGNPKERLASSTVGDWVEEAVAWPEKFPGAPVEALQAILLRRPVRTGDTRKRSEIFNDWIASGLSQRRFVAQYNESTLVKENPKERITQSALRAWSRGALAQPKKFSGARVDKLQEALNRPGRRFNARQRTLIMNGWAESGLNRGQFTRRHNLDAQKNNLDAQKIGTLQSFTASAFNNWVADAAKNPDRYPDLTDKARAAVRSVYPKAAGQGQEALSTLNVPGASSAALAGLAESPSSLQANSGSDLSEPAAYTANSTPGVNAQAYGLRNYYFPQYRQDPAVDTGTPSQLPLSAASGQHPAGDPDAMQWAAAPPPNMPVTPEMYAMYQMPFWNVTGPDTGLNHGCPPLAPHPGAATHSGYAAPNPSKAHNPFATYTTTHLPTQHNRTTQPTAHPTPTLTTRQHGPRPTR